MINSIICKENIKLKYSELDCNFALKPFFLLNFLQDIASRSAKELGFGYSYIHSHNVAWYLIKYRMEFNDYPLNLDEIQITTQPRGYNKIFAYRNFEILSNDKVLGKVSSIWALVDINTHNMIPIKDVINSHAMPPYQKNENDLSFSKIEQIEKIDLEKEFEVRFNDIDVNGHANNGNYIIWAFEPLNMDFRQNHKIKTIDMFYKKEIKYGEKIISQIEIKDNITIHTLKNKENEDLFFLKCTWENIK